MKNVLHCYSVEYQQLTVLHRLLHAVTNQRKYHKYLIINELLCYINDNDAASDDFAFPVGERKKKECALKHNSHNGGGFTVMELLMVIAIIGVLAALLFPALSLAKGYARTVDCKNHLRETGLALQMYVHDDQDQYPRYLGPGNPSYGDDTGKGGRAVGLIYWSSKLFPYDSFNWTNRVFHCPGYSGLISGPYRPGVVDRRGGYGYNLWGVRIDDRTNENFGLGPISYWRNAQGHFVPPVYQAEIREPSEMLAIGDTYMKAGDASAGDDWHVSGYAAMPFAPRHGKNYNVLLCDGHVSDMNPWVLFDPSNTASMWNYDHQPHPELWIR